MAFCVSPWFSPYGVLPMTLEAVIPLKILFLEFFTGEKV